MAKSNFFTDSDSWFNRGLSRLFDILLLGIITTVLCIPVVTIGAAVTANMDVMLRIALKKDNKIFKQYFSAFNAGEIARHIAPRPLDSSATARLVFIGSRPRSTHSTDA